MAHSTASHGAKDPDAEVPNYRTGRGHGEYRTGSSQKGHSLLIKNQLVGIPVLTPIGSGWRHTDDDGVNLGLRGGQRRTGKGARHASEAARSLAHDHSLDDIHDPGDQFRPLSNS